MHFPTRWTVHGETSPLTFGGKDRLLLLLDNEPIYELGPAVDTYRLLFSKVKSAEKLDFPENLPAILRFGLPAINSDVLKSIEPILPKGHYFITLRRIVPKLVEPGSKEDYFVQEAEEYFRNNKHFFTRRQRELTYKRLNNPQTAYYRTVEQQITEHDLLFELILPIREPTNLDSQRLKDYEQLLQDGYLPTAIAFSQIITHWQHPFSQNGRLWFLRHFLLDGHHKMYAASQLKMPLLLLSCISIDYSFVKSDDAEWMLRKQQHLDRVG